MRGGVRDRRGGTNGRTVPSGVEGTSYPDPTLGRGRVRLFTHLPSLQNGSRFHGRDRSHLFLLGDRVDSVSGKDGEYRGGWTQGHLYGLWSGTPESGGVVRQATRCGVGRRWWVSFRGDGPFGDAIRTTTTHLFRRYASSGDQKRITNGFRPSTKYSGLARTVCQTGSLSLSKDLALRAVGRSREDRHRTHDFPKGGSPHRSARS